MLLFGNVWEYFVCHVCSFFECVTYVLANPTYTVYIRVGGTNSILLDLISNLYFAIALDGKIFILLSG